MAQCATKQLLAAIQNIDWKDARCVLVDADTSGLLQKVISHDHDILDMAIRYNAPLDILTRLISPDSINQQYGDDKTALHIAVERRWDLVPVVLEHGADANLRNNSMKQTPLHLAVYHGVPSDIVTLLISHDNINMQDTDGETALHYTLAAGRWELVPDLLQHGADVNVCGFQKDTPLGVAVKFFAPEDIITQMISPYNINIQGQAGNTVLHQALEGQRWQIVPILLKHGADVNLCNAEKETPLHLGTHHGAPADLINQLISPHSVHMKDVHSKTALHMSIRKKRWELVPILLQHGADPFGSGFLPEPAKPFSLQVLSITNIRRCMPKKSDEAYEALGLPTGLLHELKLKPLSDAIKHVKSCDSDDIESGSESDDNLIV